ncbi:MAG TPA: RsmE family RNA methyltransferase [Candidatus Acidoferrales bacterium]|nr:RsmE family RNA methyltransferase [Candidatus Acidoferrales bacterium]
MRRRFFVEGFAENAATLRGDSADHLGRVLRAEAGQLYELSDGKNVWLARVELIALPKRGESRIEFGLLEPIATREPALQISLMLSIVKFDRFEWCLEKATELGVSEIVPLVAGRTDKPLISAAPNRLERWKKIALESAQQSRRLRPPALLAPIPPRQAFAECAADCKILLSERPDAPSLRCAHDQFRIAPESTGLTERAAPAAIAIGPEGGWTDDEYAAARASGFAEASLGETILRTETAVIAALAVLRFAAAP